MNTEKLEMIVGKLLAKPKGLLAIDESTESCNKRFEALGVEGSEENRRAYRELLVTTPGIEQYISGYIMYDETIRQTSTDGKRFPDILREKGIEAGIKVDQGLENFLDPGLRREDATEKVTKGLDGLADRLIEYRAQFGASFTKWRSVIVIGHNLPTTENLLESARRLAQYAKVVQDADMVPIIEPEVLLEGKHSLDTCYEVTAQNLDIVFTEMESAGVYLPGLILKTSMVMPGAESGEVADIDAVANMTIKCLREHVPGTIGGIVFLSGGQDSEHAALHLNRMHQLYPQLPWPLTFSYSRAMQNDTLQYWAKNPADVLGAQKLLLDWAMKDSQASVGGLVL